MSDPFFLAGLEADFKGDAITNAQVHQAESPDLALARAAVQLALRYRSADLLITDAQVYELTPRQAEEWATGAASTMDLLALHLSPHRAGAPR